MVEVEDQVFPVFLFFFCTLFCTVFFPSMYVNFIEQLLVSHSLYIVWLLSALLQLIDREHKELRARQEESFERFGLKLELRAKSQSMRTC